MKKIYYNGNIITLDKTKHADCVITEGDTIIFVGKLKHSQVTLTNEDQYIDLKGKTLMPAFFEGYGHYIASINNQLQLNLHHCHSYATLKDLIQQFETKLKEKDWIIASNYHADQWKEKKEMTRLVLDKMTEHPMMITTIDGKTTIFNTKALQQLKVKITDKDKGIKTQEEVQQWQESIPTPTVKQLASAVERTNQLYASMGITTVCESTMTTSLLPVYQYMYDNDLLQLDTIGYTDKDSYEDYGNYFSDEYRHHFRLGGINLILDGRAESMMAHMKTSYKGTKYYGQPNISQDQLRDDLQWAKENNIHVTLECNGNKCFANFVKILKEYDKKEIVSRQYILTQCGMIEPDQIYYMRRYGITPCFDINKIHDDGDALIGCFGKARCRTINPLKTCKKKGIAFGLYNNIVSGNSTCQSIKNSLTRVTKNGILLNYGEHIKILDALKGLTIHPAKMYNEPKKGSIAKGKLANFVILSNNPLKCKIYQLETIQVETTIMNGEVIYQK